MLLAIIIIIITFVVLLRLYIKSKNGKCRSSRRLDGKTAIVTGSNTGIGKETARDLAERGARVILACRNTQKAELAKYDIINSTGNKNVVVKKIDLSSMKSVREFAKDVIENEKRLDILVNNAGLAGLKRKLTEEGLEYTLASNHFGPFLLTNLLLGLMKKSAPSRIVVVTSVMHKLATLDPKDLNDGADNPLDISQNLYSKSKLANVLFVKELASRLEGTGVSVYAVHPGTIMSDIWNNLWGPFYTIVSIVGTLFFKTVKEGSQTSIYCAVSEEVEGLSGSYFEECKEHKPSRAARDKDLAKNVWEMSEVLVELKESEIHL